MITSLLKQSTTNLMGLPRILDRKPEVDTGSEKQEDLTLREDFIKSTSLFAALTEVEQHAIGACMRLEHYKHDETLFVKDGRSDTLYLIQQGWIKLYDGDEDPIVTNLGPGSLLGEIDFFLGRPYTTTAHAFGNVTVWALDSDALANLISGYPEIGLNLGLALGTGIVHFQELLADRLAEFSLFQDSSEGERKVVARRLSPQCYLPREIIYRSNDPPTGIFFIERGRVWLLGDTDADTTELGAGEIFGEEAMISETLHSNTAQAITEAIIWQLSPIDFTHLVDILPCLKTRFGHNLHHDLTEALTIASQIVDREIEALATVCGGQHQLVRKLRHINQTLSWLKNNQGLL